MRAESWNVDIQSWQFQCECETADYFNAEGTVAFESLFDHPLIWIAADDSNGCHSFHLITGKILCFSVPHCFSLISRLYHARRRNYYEVRVCNVQISLVEVLDSRNMSLKASTSQNHSNLDDSWNRRKVKQFRSAGNDQTWIELRGSEIVIHLAFWNLFSRSGAFRFTFSPTLFHFRIRLRFHDRTLRRRGFIVTKQWAMSNKIHHPLCLCGRKLFLNNFFFLLSSMSFFIIHFALFSQWASFFIISFVFRYRRFSSCSLFLPFFI
jgi:hypothetical protein